VSVKISKGLVLGAGLVAALSGAVPGFAGGNKFDSVNDSRDCGDGDVVNWVGPITLWPPNHKFVAETVTAVADDGGEDVELTLMPVVTDVAGGDGGPNHDPDYTPEDPAAVGMGSATVNLNLRAERSGKGDGRTYTIEWAAKFADNECSSTEAGQSPFVVNVPHDMGVGQGKP
jgi:hypothetical protein